MAEEASTKKKVPKFVIVIIVIVVLMIFGAIGGGGKTSTSGSSSTSASAAAASSKAEAVAADKTELKNSIDEYSAIDGAGYTEDSFNKLKDAIDKATRVFDDSDATQAEVDAAEKAMDTAWLGLVEQFDPSKYSAPAFSDVARNPDSFVGQKLVFSGKVLQVVEGTSEVDARIATDGAYDDIIFVGYDPKIVDFRILEDDMVTVYGTCLGLYTYESTLGASISLPALYLDAIELQ